MKLLLAQLCMISVVVATAVSPPPCFLPEENRYANERDLSKHIFARNLSNEWERPVINESHVVGLSIDLEVAGIFEVDEKHQQVSLSGNLFMVWKDEIHVWEDDPRFSCMDHIIMPWGRETGLWIPDLAFTDADNKFLLTRAPNEQLRIGKDGTTSFNPGSTLEFRCAFDLSFFPFDTQTCPMVFETWRYTGAYEVLTYAHAAKQNIFIESDQWTLLWLGAEIENTTYPSGDVYPRATFFIRMQRKAKYYLLSVVLPCVLVAVVELATFATPHDKHLRLEVSFTSLLAFSVFQSTVVADLPRSADRPPLLLIFITVVTIYIACAIFGQAMSFHFAAKAKRCLKSEPGTKAASRTLLAICNSLAAVVMVKPYSGLTLRKRSAIADSSDINSPGIQATPKAKSRTWQFVAEVVDRYTFLLFLSLMVATLFAFLVIVPLVAH